MKTRRFFKENVYMKNASSRLTSIVNTDGFSIVTFEGTIFFPEGGGQPCDTGKLYYAGNEYLVLSVNEDSEDIYHKISPALSGNISDYPDEFKMELDWDRRFDSMQRHCGEHILTGIFYREYKVINRGFHMGDDYMTIDLAIEDEAKEIGIEKIDWAMCKNAELLTNEVIQENMPMITRHFDTYDEAKNEPMRKKLAIKEDITLVGIGKPEYDWGCVACCGTHPETTGQVGMVKIYKIESNKGMFRVYFEAGKRAFKKYQDEFDILTTVSRKVSAGTEDLISKFESQEEKNREKFNQLHLLKKLVVSMESEKILSGDGSTYKYDVLTIDDMMAIAKEICPKLSRIVFLVHIPSNTVLLLSNGDPDCGKLVKENASIYNGKGGGNKTLARAIFSKYEYIDVFIDLIQKHLR